MKKKSKKMNKEKKWKLILILLTNQNKKIGTNYHQLIQMKTKIKKLLMKTLKWLMMSKCSRNKKSK